MSSKQLYGLTLNERNVDGVKYFTYFLYYFSKSGDDGENKIISELVVAGALPRVSVYQNTKQQTQ